MIAVLPFFILILLVLALDLSHLNMNGRLERLLYASEDTEEEFSQNDVSVTTTTADVEDGLVNLNFGSSGVTHEDTLAAINEIYSKERHNGS